MERPLGISGYVRDCDLCYIGGICLLCQLLLSWRCFPNESNIKKLQTSYPACQQHLWSQRLKAEQTCWFRFLTVSNATQCLSFHRKQNWSSILKLALWFIYCFLKIKGSLFNQSFYLLFFHLCNETEITEFYSVKGGAYLHLGKLFYTLIDKGWNPNLPDAANFPIPYSESKKRDHLLLMYTVFPF